MDKKERRENFKMLSIYTGAFLISCMFVYGIIEKQKLLQGGEWIVRSSDM